MGKVVSNIQFFYKELRCIFLRFHLFEAAASLSYTTILSVIPTLAVAFAFFSGFPAFNVLKNKAEITILEYFAPNASADVHHQLQVFLENASQLPAVGVLCLLVSAAFLFLSVEGTFNRIWRVDVSRPLHIRLCVFWSVLTISPLCFVVVSEFIPLILLEGREWFIFNFCLQLIPLFLAYKLIPHCRVYFWAAFTGAFVGVALIQFLKMGFKFYIDYVTSYQAVYGVLASIPVILLWLYISWLAILVGAVFAAFKSPAFVEQKSCDAVCQ